MVDNEFFYMNPIPPVDRDGCPAEGRRGLIICL